MGAGLLLSLDMFLCFFALISSKVWQIPIPDSLQSCYNRANSADVETFVASVFTWTCEQTHLNPTYAPKPIPKETISFINQLFEKDFTTARGNRTRRQAPSRCVRKEYRMLTTEERRRYHAAINALKADTTVLPNKYDAIARVHTEATRLIAHGGPGFLGWHRIYLLIYEKALRQVDPRVCLPYWDSTLDSKLQDPVTSSLWTPEFLGTSRESVYDGPFANWRIPTRGQLIRSIGVDGSVMTTDQVNNILSMTRYEQILPSDYVDPQNQIDNIHGSVHGFVGGTMSTLMTAAYEPAFYMHHAFIDYIFERFRAKLRSINVNASLYPSTKISLHLGSATTTFGKYTQADGYGESIASMVIYQPVPTCNATSPTCGTGSSLVCRTTDWLCVPTTTKTPVRARSKRQATTQDTCIKPATFDLPNQNDFCVGDTCDTDEWVMIPVKIISVRPPKFGKYDSYPVKRGRIDRKRDIYAPNINDKTKKLIFNRQGNPKTYDRCKEDTAVGQIFLYSQGMNYPGHYKESVIVDQKLTVSVSLGFIGVKKPSEKEGGVTRALLRAHDACGRVCHVSCKDIYSKNKKCSGAVAVDETYPLMYGRSFDEAILSVIDFSRNNDAPDVKEEDILVTFYCDYRKNFPFANKNKTKTP